MWLYISGVISLFGFAFFTTSAADYFQLPWRIAVTMAGGPFLALAMWCFATARWQTRDPSHGARLVAHPRMLWLYAAAAFVVYCILVSMADEFTSPTRIAVKMTSGTFFGIAILCFVRALAALRSGDSDITRRVT